MYQLSTALMAAGDMDTLREFMANSIPGALGDDEAMRADLAASLFDTNPYLTWKTEDGHCCYTIDSYMLIVRGLKARMEQEGVRSLAEVIGQS